MKSLRSLVAKILHRKQPPEPVPTAPPKIVHLEIHMPTTKATLRDVLLIREVRAISIDTTILDSKRPTGRRPACLTIGLPDDIVLDVRSRSPKEHPSLMLVDIPRDIRAMLAEDKGIPMDVPREVTA